MSICSVKSRVLFAQCSVVFWKWFACVLLSLFSKWKLIIWNSNIRIIHCALCEFYHNLIYKVDESTSLSFIPSSGQVLDHLHVIFFSHYPDRSDENILAVDSDSDNEQTNISLDTPQNLNSVTFVKQTPGKNYLVVLFISSFC